ncbi:hypothetical protein N431DRAFT_471439 [Stipitochalara longipes BDJ]|nr:hypothetical protein N431DRAFT_471439 [Stipitochalara longipes BDJ]
MVCPNVPQGQHIPATSQNNMQGFDNYPPIQSSGSNGATSFGPPLASLSILQQTQVVSQSKAYSPSNLAMPSVYNPSGLAMPLIYNPSNLAVPSRFGSASANYAAQSRAHSMGSSSRMNGMSPFSQPSSPFSSTVSHRQKSKPVFGQTSALVHGSSSLAHSTASPNHFQSTWVQGSSQISSISSFFQPQTNGQFLPNTNNQVQAQSTVGEDSMMGGTTTDLDCTHSQSISVIQNNHRTNIPPANTVLQNNGVQNQQNSPLPHITTSSSAQSTDDIRAQEQAKAKELYEKKFEKEKAALITQQERESRIQVVQHKGEMRKIEAEKKALRNHLAKHKKYAKEREIKHRKLVADAGFQLNALAASQGFANQKELSELQEQIRDFSSNAKSKQQDIENAALKDNLAKTTREKEELTKTLGEQKLQLAKVLEEKRLQEDNALVVAAKAKQENDERQKEFEEAGCKIKQLEAVIRAQNVKFRDSARLERENNDMRARSREVERENSYLKASINPGTRLAIAREYREAPILREKLDAANARIAALERSQQTDRMICRNVGSGGCAHVSREKKSFKEQVEKIPGYEAKISRLESELNSNRRTLEESLVIQTEAIADSKETREVLQLTKEKLQIKERAIETLQISVTNEQINSEECRRAMELTSMFAFYMQAISSGLPVEVDQMPGTFKNDILTDFFQSLPVLSDAYLAQSPSAVSPAVDLPINIEDNSSLDISNAEEFEKQQSLWGRCTTWYWTLVGKTFD